jgi:hypothetical protein
LLYECLLTLFKGRTVILVTHAVNLVLPKAEHVVVVKNGSVFAQGTLAEVIKNESVTDIVAKDLVGIVQEEEYRATEETLSLKSVPQGQNKEGKAAGSVKWHIYRSYIVACGGFMFIFGVFFSFAIQVSADYLQNWWIEVWTDALKHNIGGILNFMNLPTELFVTAISVNPLNTTSNLGDPLAPNDNLYYIAVFGLISFIELFALLFKYMVQFIGGIRASRVRQVFNPRSCMKN